MSFEDMIDRVSVPLVLVYGKEDPWVVPLWGHKIKRQRPETLYYQVLTLILYSYMIYGRSKLGKVGNCSPGSTCIPM